MLTVKVKKVNSIIEYVKLTGHTKYDDLGKDIVCASASSIYITTINSILMFDKESITYNDSNEIINIKKDYITNNLIENMINMLKELESKYKKNIKIMEE